MFESHLKPPISFPSVSGAVCSFDSQYAGLPLKSHKIDLTATQSGSGTPSPDNPRAISGWDAINIQNTAGINQWDEQWEVGTYNSSGQKAVDNRIIRNKNLIRITPSTTYYAQSTGVALVYYFYDANRNYISGSYVTNNTFTSSDNAYYMNFRMSADYGNVYNNNISINYPSTDTSYHAFVGQSITIQIGSTIYGGTFDAITGILTVTHEIVEMSSISYNAGFGGYYTGYYANTIKLPDTSANSDLMCSCFAVGDTIGGDNMFIQPIGSSYAGYIIILPSATYQDANAFRNSLQGQYLVYPLKTPTTLQLPPCPIETQAGVNNVFADTGDTTLQYIKLG